MAAGPPPGLGMMAPPAAALPPNPFGSNGSNSHTQYTQHTQRTRSSQHSPQYGDTDAVDQLYQRPADCPRIYGRGILLAYCASPLATKPVAMRTLRDWYGEWEPFHYKSNYNNHREGRDSSRRNHVEEAPQHSEQDDGTNNGGIIGGALGGFGPRREGAGARFGARRNEDRERGEGLRLGEVSSRRIAPAGKNPFGQISASGTFKPAGSAASRAAARDAGAGDGEGRRFGMGERSTSFGKDRMRDMLPDERRGQRDRFGEARDTAGGGRDRRRGGDRALDGDESREEGEIIESPRVRRTGGADSAADWRKPGDRERAGPFANSAADRRTGDRRGGPGGRQGGGQWSGDADDNPAWLDDDSESLPVDNRAPFGQFGTRRREGGGADGADDMDGAVDSIQAFKAQMKERERRERLARGELDPNDSSAHTPSSGPPPGLGRDASGEYSFGNDRAATHESEMDQIRSEMAAAANQRNASGGSMFDSISNSHGGAGSEGSAPPGLPGRSSRFARFFDARGGPPRDPQAAALAAQQKMLESMGGRSVPSDGESHSATAAKSPSAEPAAASSIDLSQLFSKAAVRENVESPAATTDKPDKNVTEADQQSMQKLMAMLQGGGGIPGPAVSASAQGSENRDTSTPTNASNNHVTRPESANRLRELLGGESGRRNESAEHLAQRMMSPGLTPGEGPAPEARSPLPYDLQQQQQQQQQQQHQRMPSSSSTQGQQNAPQQQQQQQQQRPGGMGSYGGFPGAVPGRPPPGMDPRMMGRPPVGVPGFQQLPPHIAAALSMGRGPIPPPGMGPMPPMAGAPGPRGPNGPFPGFGPFPGGRPPPPGMPPQMYQQLMSMPPHIQQQVLAGHAFPPPGGMGGPPRSPYDMPASPGAGGGGGGGVDRRPQSPDTQAFGSPQGPHPPPPFPYYAQGPGMSSPPPPTAPSSVGPQAINGANLMALLSGGRNTPTGNANQ